MDQEAAVPRLVRFGAFELDLIDKELRRQGLRIKLHEKPLQILLLLLERAGQVVDREDLRQRLWPADTYVNFDANLNTSLSNLRHALGDSSDSPIFIETIPRRGYRFVAPITRLNDSTKSESHTPDPTQTFPAPAEQPGLETPAREMGRFPRLLPVLAGILLVATGIASLAYIYWFGPSTEAKGSTHKTTILVTPFINLSGDSKQDYLSEGLTDELITRLGQSSPQYLSVIARSTSMQYEHSPLPVNLIARQQKVDYVLEGSFHREGDQVHITAQLFRAKDQGSLWAEAYDRDAANLLSIQSDVANRIAESLSLKVLPDATSLGAPPEMVNSEAYDDYLKGIFACNRASLEGEQGAIQLLRRSVNEDPRFARAYAALASCYGASFHFGFLSSEATHEQAKAAALKALELDSSLEDAHLALANILYEYDWDWAASEREFRRALEINPSSASAHRFYSGYLTMVGRYDEALIQVRMAQQLDPISLDTRSMACLVLNASREYKRAIEECQKILELDPSSVLAGYYVATAHLYLKDYAQSLSELKKLRAANNDSSHTFLLVASAIANAAEGNQSDAKKGLEELITLSKSSLVTPYELAEVYSHFGDKEQTFAHLNEAFDQHSYDLVYLASDADFDEIRADPRYQVIERRLEYPNSVLEAPFRQASK